MVITTVTKNTTQRKTLSIRISTNGFCFCTYIPSNPDSIRYFAYTPDEERSMASNIRSAVEECPLIIPGEKYDIKAIIETDEYTCIPTAHDNTEDYKQFFSYCFPKSCGGEIIANKLNAQGFTIIFSVETSIYEAIKELGDVTFYNPASIIIGYLGYKPMTDKQYMLAYLYNDLTIIISMKDEKAGLTNIFRKEESANILFYMLSIWKETGLSQTDDTLYLCGDNKVDSFSHEASQFIRNIKRINPNELFPSTLLNRIEGIPFDLQALILCE